jgi:hypothetical protein
MYDYMYESQRPPKIESKSLTKVDKETSKKLNEAILECIIEDSRPFGDFRKKGMLEFLKLVKKI